MKSGKSVIRTEAADDSAGKILLVIGDAAEITDTLYPWMRLQEARYEVVVAAPDVRTYSLVQHQRPDGWDITRESPGYQMQSDIAFKDIKPAEYAGLLVSGGRAPEYIRYDEHLLTAVRWLLEAGRPIGSVCHGIEVLATAGVIEGKRITTVPKCRFDAEVCGATYVDAAVIVDGLIVTARGALDGWQWMREYLGLLEAVGNQATSDRL
jgi:protease I